MNRMLLGGLAVLAIGVAASCGGKTEVTPGASQGGSSGAGGNGGAAGGQAGHAGGGGTGGTTGSWSYCQGPGWCLDQYNGCCPPCGLEKIGDLSGVNRDPGQIKAFRASQCSDPVPNCPGCVMQIDPNLAAFCVSSQCQMIDVRTDNVSKCTSGSECVLRYPDCCEQCGGPAPDMLIAINGSKASAYNQQVCDPNGADCPPCVPQYPSDWVAVCGSDGHCKPAQVQAPGACPSAAPDYNTACSQAGLHCSWGDDPRVDCRKNADCINGQWIFIPTPSCVPLPGAGQAGCPKDLSANGSDCAGLEKTICDMSAAAGTGALCVCDQCTGGPCTQYGRWWCQTAPSGCPQWAPNVGQTCNVAGQSCVYGACGTETSVGRVCGDGNVWKDQAIACPE